jgi:hypothetical protein
MTPGSFPDVVRDLLVHQLQVAATIYFKLLRQRLPMFLHAFFRMDCVLAWVVKDPRISGTLSR